MPLTDTAIRKAKPTEKPQRLFDGGGMYLEISPAGGKWWRLKYRFAGKEKRLSFAMHCRIDSCSKPFSCDFTFASGVSQAGARIGPQPEGMVARAIRPRGCRGS